MTVLFLVSLCVDLIHGMKNSQIRGFRIPDQHQETTERHLLPQKRAKVQTFVVGEGDGQESDFYQFDVDGLLPSSDPSNSPTDSPAAQLITSPRDPTIGSPTNSPSQPPFKEVVQAQEQDFLPIEGEVEAEVVAESNQREPNAPAGDEAEEVLADEPLTPETDVDPTDADQFLPAGDPTYYYADLRPFSVFVEADRDLSTDLGIPLYLLLEMGETLSTLVDIKITNLTIHMEVTHTPGNARHRRAEEDHFHWNQLYFQGLAQLDDSSVYPPATVQNIQSLVLSNEDNLQTFWDDQGYGETYDNLELQNITLLPFPAEPEPAQPGTLPPTVSPTPGPTTQQPTHTVVHEDSKRESNIWIMVPLVILFLMICFCIICLAGRLQYLSSRAQDKYNEKYGLDYNIYDKDISKDIFKEEYLMSEHDHDFSSQGDRSIEFLTNTISSMKSARSSSQQAKKLAPDDPSTEEEEEELPGNLSSGEVRKVSSAEEYGNMYSSSNGPVESARNDISVRGASEQLGAFPSNQAHDVVVDEGIILPRWDANEGDTDDVESVPMDEDELEEPVHDAGDVMPPMITFGGTPMVVSIKKDEGGRSGRSGDTAAVASNDKSDMGNSNSSGRERSGRYQPTAGSLSFIGDDRGAMNSSRSSRGDRSRYTSKGSFHSAIEGDPNLAGNSGRGDRSTRSNRSIRSLESATSTSSFYSCQGDLV